MRQPEHDRRRSLVPLPGHKGQLIMSRPELRKGAYVRVVGFSNSGWLGRVREEGECDGEGDYLIEPIDSKHGFYEWYYARYLEPISLLEAIAQVAQDPK